MEVKRMKMDGREFAFICDWHGTRNGFAHDVTMMENWRTLAKARLHYINRTWECWSYQSAILEAVDEVMTERAERMERKLKSENGWGKMTATRRETLRRHLELDSEYSTLQKLYKELKGHYPAWAN